MGSTVCVLRTQLWQRHAAPPPLAAPLLPQTKRRVGLRALGVLVLFLGLQEARPAGGFPISDLLPLLMWKALRAQLPPTPHERGRGSAATLVALMSRREKGGVGGRSQAPALGLPPRFWSTSLRAANSGVKLH